MCVIGEGRFLFSVAEDSDEFRTPSKRRKLGCVGSIRPESLMDGGGGHFDDCSYKLISAGQNADHLPRQVILEQVQMFHHECRPSVSSKLN